MILWVDDIRPPLLVWRKGYLWVYSVNDAKMVIEQFEKDKELGRLNDDAKIEWIDLDHDAGDFYSDGGDYIRLLDWLEERGSCYPIRIHSMNPVGAENMRTIIRRNHWEEVF